MNETISKVKKQPSECEKITIEATNKELISKYTPTPTILKYNVHFMKNTLIEG